MELRSARQFSCASCRTLALICSACDRGSIYCPPCAPSTRAERQRAARRKYRNTTQGRRQNAAAQARFRERQRQLSRMPKAVVAKIVMDQGSLPEPPCSSLDAVSLPIISTNLICHFCGRPVFPQVRLGFLRRKERVETPPRRSQGEFT